MLRIPRGALLRREKKKFISIQGMDLLRHHGSMNVKPPSKRKYNVHGGTKEEFLEETQEGIRILKEKSVRRHEGWTLRIDEGYTPLGRKEMCHETPRMDLERG